MGNPSSLPMVLVVDDDPMMSHAIASAVRRGGWLPFPVASASEAKSSLSSRVWAAVICDLQLADESGLSVIAAARVAGGPPRIVAITGLADGDFYLKVALRAGAHAVLPKPFTAEALLAALRPGSAGPVSESAR